MPPRIDRRQCNDCGTCIFECGARVFGMDPRLRQVTSARARDCVDCFICEATCPNQAITVVPRRIREENGLRGGGK